jgi:cystathionine gamma-synthase
MQRATTAVTAGRPPGPGATLNTPPVFASTFRDGGETGYGRHDNPTWQALETSIAALEGGSGAVAFGSGQAATAAVLAGLPVGSRVVGPAVGYLGTRGLLGELSAGGALDVELVDVTDTDAVRAALAGPRRADLLWLESPTNPLLEIADLPALCAAARSAGAVTVVDNTIATPLRQRPLELGADLVVHSATKFIGGHSDLLLGLVVATDPQRVDALRARRTGTGAVPGVSEAYLALRGLRTLDVRLTRAEATAAELARRLSAHPLVDRVRYPGLAGGLSADRLAAQADGPGAVLAFEVGGADGRAAGERVLAALRLIVAATSFGGVETTLDLRIRWAGEDPGRPGLLRLSAGLEDVEDLWEDLDTSLRAALTRAGTAA